MPLHAKVREKRIAKIERWIAEDPQISVNEIARKLKINVKNTRRFLHLYGLNTTGMLENVNQRGTEADRHAARELEDVIEDETGRPPTSQDEAGRIPTFGKR